MSAVIIKRRGKWSDEETVWQHYKGRRRKRMKSGFFHDHDECVTRGVLVHSPPHTHTLTFDRFQVDPAALGANRIVHLAEVDACQALRVVADFQLPGHTV